MRKKIAFPLSFILLFLLGGEISPIFAEKVPNEKIYTGQRISMDFKEAEIGNVLRIIAEVSKLNIVAGEEVKGKITIRLKNVPWDQALDLILEASDMGMTQAGNVIRVLSLSRLKKMEEERKKEEEEQKKKSEEQKKIEEETLKAKRTKEQIEDLTTILIPLSYAKASDIEKILRSEITRSKEGLETEKRGIMSARGSVIADERTNTLIIKDIRKNVDDILALIKSLDTPIPQVLIEARIVEASTDFARELGIQWGGKFKDNDFILTGGGIGTTTGTSPDKPATGGVGLSGQNFVINLPATVGTGIGGSLGITIGKLTGDILDIQLSAMEKEGEGKIISTPKVTTLHNREASISQGISIPYETVSQDGTKTEFVDATLELKVTPQITPDGSVILKLKVTKNAPGAIITTKGVPSIDKKEVNTEILMKDNETTVIGGILTSENVQSRSGVPWFSDIPILGYLFKKNIKSDKKTELLIFITPKIVKSSAG